MSDRAGTKGTPVAVYANMFRVVSLPKREFYHYHDIMQPMANGTLKEVKVRDRAREIVEKLQNDNAAIFVPRASFDGMKNMYSTADIQQGNFVVNLSRNPNATRGKFHVTIKRVNTIRPGDLERLMSPDATNKSQANNTAVNLLQIIISQAPNIKHHFALHAKSFFIRGDSDRKLAPGLQIWHGFFQSVRPVLNSIMININTTATAIYTPGPLLEGAMSLLGCRDSRELVQRCKDERAGAQAMRKLKSFYKGVIVTVGPNKSKRKIEDIVPRAGFVEFEKSGQMSTVQEHFREHHHIALRFPEAFGVRVGKSAIFPAEVCDVFPGQIYRKQLDGPATTDMLRETAVRPDQRLDNIRKAISRDALDYGSSPFMRDAGMRVDTNPLETRGRRLQPPGVMYGNGTLHVRDGAWNVVNKTFQLPAKIIAWAVVSFDANPNAQRSAVHLAQTLCVNMKKLGIVFQQEEPHISPGNQARVHESLTKAAMDTVKGFNDPQIKPGFVLVILPANAAPLRKEVKQWGDMLVGIPTQCVRAGKYEQANDQYCNNLALKINTKTGGINSILHSPISDFLKDCMIVGCDVAHPSPGVTSRPSIASLVASEDEFATRYSTEVQVQPPRQESIDGIGGMIERAIKRYSEKQRRFPGRIVIYRDGVSEGEYAQVETNEIQAIKDVLDDLERHTRHKAELIFIVVGKRHHVRFFPKDRSDADRTGNCFPGLVVDREIVHSTYMDFYLQSQGGLKGTSRPSHYIVLKNDANRSADLLQELSFALCHVYAAATRSVSIPAPVYYADRLCTRAVFQFRPELDYADESSTETSEFSLEKWQQGLGQSILKQQMYFI